MRYSLDELARSAGITPYLVRHHIRRGLLARAHGHSTDAYYDDEHLARLLAIQRLRKGGVRIHDVGAKLAALDAAKAKAAAAKPVTLPASAPAHELWEHLPLWPGVELRVRADADVHARRIVAAMVKAWAEVTGAG
jgi:DNA-binding transcriptional MerR regulator